MTDASSHSASTSGTGTPEAGEGSKYPVLAFDLMCAREQHARRLLAQDHPPNGRFDQERRIRLPALVLVHAKTTAETVQPPGEPRVERGDVEPVRFANLDEDRIVAAGIHACR